MNELHLSWKNRWIFCTLGVVAGFARYFNTDPGTLRLFTVVFSILFVGTPIIAYLLVWLVMLLTVGYKD